MPWACRVARGGKVSCRRDIAPNLHCPRLRWVAANLAPRRRQFPSPPVGRPRSLSDEATSPRFALLGMLCLLPACAGGGSGSLDRAAARSTSCSPIAPADELTQFEVDVRDIVFRKVGGSTVSVMPRATRVDFLQLETLSELVAARSLEAGRYDRITLTLDFTEAEIFLADQSGAGDRRRRARQCDHRHVRRRGRSVDRISSVHSPEPRHAARAGPRPRAEPGDRRLQQRGHVHAGLERRGRPVEPQAGRDDRHPAERRRRQAADLRRAPRARRIGRQRLLGRHRRCDRVPARRRRARRRLRARLARRPPRRTHLGAGYARRRRRLDPGRRRRDRRWRAGQRSGLGLRPRRRAQRAGRRVADVDRARPLPRLRHRHAHLQHAAHRRSVER